MAKTVRSFLVQLSPQGQLTLPAEVRRALGLRSGDAFRVSIQEGSVVLEPVSATSAVTTAEFYTDERLAEFQKNAEMTAEELARARSRWGL